MVFALTNQKFVWISSYIEKAPHLHGNNSMERLQEKGLKYIDNKFNPRAGLYKLYNVQPLKHELEH